MFVGVSVGVDVGVFVGVEVGCVGRSDSCRRKRICRTCACAIAIADSGIPFIGCSFRQARPGDSRIGTRGNRCRSHYGEGSRAVLHIIGERKLAVRIRLKLTEHGGIGLYGDRVIGRREGHDPQPAIASVCPALII